jgi:hypothetical protein
MATPYGQLDMGHDTRRPLDDSGGFSALLGPISSGLHLVQGLFDAANMFSAGKALQGQAGQYRVLAAQALKQGFATGIDIRREGKEIVGEMTAAFGKSGSLLEGSPLLVLADTQTQIERNAGRAIEQGRIQQQAYLWEAAEAERAAEQAKKGGIGRIVGALVGALGGPVASTIYDLVT